MCRTLYDNYNFSREMSIRQQSGDVNQATNDTKIKFADNVRLSGSLPVCFLYNILGLNFRAKDS